MAQTEQTPSQNDDAPICTRSNGYRPPLPETQSAVSRWIVRIEASAGITVAIALLAYATWRNREINEPVRIASMASSIVIAPGAAHGALEEDVDVSKGQMLYMQACTSCHGQRGHGMPHQGVSLRQSKFIESTTDRALVAFLKKGRPATDPKNATGIPMPPRGGNPSLDDDALAHIVAFLRQVQKEQSTETPDGSPTAALREPATRPVATAGDERASIDTSPE